MYVKSKLFSSKIKYQILQMGIDVHLFGDDAKFPEKIEPNVFQLFASETVDIAPLDRQLVNTNIAIKFPDDCYGRIISNYELMTNNGVLCGDAIISNFEKISILLFNCSNQFFYTRIGQPIALLILEKKHNFELNPIFIDSDGKKIKKFKHHVINMLFNKN